MTAVRLRGFTLIEMLVTITIVGVLAALGVPAFKDMIASQKVKTAAASMQAALNLARSEALKRNGNVTMAPAGQWSAGWNVQDSGGNSLQVFPAVSSVAVAGPSSIVYQGTGRIANQVANTSFKISSSDTATVRCVNINLSGTASLTSSGC